MPVAMRIGILLWVEISGLRWCYGQTGDFASMNNYIVWRHPIMNLERDLILASVEEDNIQRAYFRVRPLLTVEGMVEEEARQLWPNEGGLRIVPDRAEQHTFKERMRQLGGWCVVDLTRFAPEANKIRTNKNYHPERGEVNQYILYSDTVGPVPETIFYEVLAGQPDDYEALAAKAITPCFYIRSDDTLYGPVRRAALAKPETAKPAEGVLFEISAKEGETHQVMCIAAELPEKPVAAEPAAMTEADPAAAEAPAAAPAVMVPVAPVAKPVPAASKAQLPPPVQRVAERPAPAPKNVPEKPAEESLPIGQSLNILDHSRTFEETLSGLNQPVSASANLLRHQTALAASQPQDAPKLTGTPLYRAPVRTSAPQPKNKLQEIVYSQCRVVRNDPPADPLPAGCTMRHVDNPVEKACAALRSAWSVPEAQNQLINCILSLDGIVPKLEPHAAKAYSGSALQSALQARLDDLEAERLTALVQLDQAKAELDTFRRNSIEAASEKARKDLTVLEKDRTAMTAAVEEIRQQVNALVTEREALAAQISELQNDAIPASLIKLLGDCAVTAPVRTNSLRLSPVCGQRVELKDMLARVEAMCAKSGVAYDRNRAIALMMAMTVSHRVGIQTNAPAAAATLGSNLAHALGWQTGYAVLQQEGQQPMVTAAPANATPAILLTADDAAAPMEHVCQLMLTADAAKTAHTAAYALNQWPIMPLPAYGFVPSQPEAGEPIAAAVLSELVSETVVAREKVQEILKPVLAHIPPLSGEAGEAMFSFVNGCAHWMDGGLPAATDWALLMWVLPALERTPEKLAAVKPLLAEYPMSQAALS